MLWIINDTLQDVFNLFRTHALWSHDESNRSLLNIKLGEQLWVLLVETGHEQDQIERPLHFGHGMEKDAFESLENGQDLRLLQTCLLYDGPNGTGGRWITWIDETTKDLELVFREVVFHISYSTYRVENVNQKLRVYIFNPWPQVFDMNIEFPEGMKVGYELEFCSNAPIPTSISRPLLDWFDLGVDRSLAPRNPYASMYEIRSKHPLNVVSLDVIKLMLDQLELVNELPPVPGWRRWTTGTTRGRPRWVVDTARDAGDFYSTFSTNTTVSYNTTNTTYSNTTYSNTNYDCPDRLEHLGGRVDLDRDSVPFTPVGKNIFTTKNCGMHVHISWENKRMAHILYGHLANVLTQKVKPFEERKEYCCPDFNSSRGARYNALRWVHTESGHFEVRLFNGTMKLRGIVNNLRMIRNEALLVARASQAAIRTQSANSHGGLGSPAIG